MIGLPMRKALGVAVMGAAGARDKRGCNDQAKGKPEDNGHGDFSKRFRALHIVELKRGFNGP